MNQMRFCTPLSHVRCRPPSSSRICALLVVRKERSSSESFPEAFLNPSRSPSAHSSTPELISRPSAPRNSDIPVLTLVDAGLLLGAAAGDELRQPLGGLLDRQLLHVEVSGDSHAEAGF